MRIVKFETKPIGLRLCSGRKEILSGEYLQLKIDEKWVIGVYIFEPKTNSHYFETGDPRRYQLDINSQLRYPPISRYSLLVPFVYFVAVIGDLLFYFRQKLNNKKNR